MKKRSEVEMSKYANLGILIISTKEQLDLINEIRNNPPKMKKSSFNASLQEYNVKYWRFKKNGNSCS